MKIMIAYFSQTGNTAKVAQAIYEAAVFQDHKVYLEEVGEITPDGLTAYDLIFLGSACHDSDLAKPAKRVLGGIPSSPPFKLAGFATHAAYTSEGGEREREVYEEWAARCELSFHQASQEKQIEFLGYYHCQGAPSPPIEAFIRNTIVTDEGEWKTYIEEVKRHPDEEDLQQAREFARQVLAMC
jgi:flavodoxin